MNARETYLQAWAEWSGAPADMAPAFTADRTTLARTDRAAGKADSGPRRAHGSDDTVSLVHAARAEAVDGLALALAIGALFGHRTDSPRAVRAYRSIERIESAYASTVALMGNDTTVACDGLAGAYRWTPEAVDMTNPARPVPYANGRPLPIERHGGHWRAYCKRSGWNSGAAGDLREGASERADQQLVKRSTKYLLEALRRIERAEVPTEAPGGGRPAGWIAAVRWLQTTGRTDFTGPQWLQGRAAPVDAREPLGAVAWVGVDA